MLKKRIIFKLYFKNNYFCLSRNFNLQKVGNVDWLFNNLNFSNIAKFIDELVIINVNEKNYKNPMIKEFKFAIQKLMKNTFIPLTIGGGLRNLSQVNECFAIGADKILLNTAIRKDKKFVKDCIKKFGSQAILCGIDFKLEKDNFYTYTGNGKEKFFSLKKHITLAKNIKIGELFLTSIDRDGTGFGYEKKFLNI
jgi:cyclase